MAPMIYLASDNSHDFCHVKQEIWYDSSDSITKELLLIYSESDKTSEFSQ